MTRADATAWDVGCGVAYQGTLEYRVEVPVPRYLVVFEERASLIWP